jgi:hypothetical protein
MFTVTHTATEAGYKTTVLRAGDVTAVCKSVRRGGCLYMGTITLFNIKGGFTTKTVESSMGIGLLTPLEKGEEVSETLNAYLLSLVTRYVLPLSEISPTELSRLAQTGQYTPDSMVASWYK